METSKKRIKICFLLSLLLFILLVCLLKQNKLLAVDEKIVAALEVSSRPQILEVMKCITKLGSTAFLLCLLFIYIYKTKRLEIGIIQVLNLGLVNLINRILKIWIKRPRPSGISFIYEKGYSFPSGHAMNSFAFYGLFIYLIYKYKKRKGICLLLGGLVLVIGFSRMYLGVHYPSDILAGYCISYMYLVLFIKIGKKLRKKREEKDERKRIGNCIK